MRFLLYWKALLDRFTLSPPWNAGMDVEINKTHKLFADNHQDMICGVWDFTKEIMFWMTSFFL